MNDLKKKSLILTAKKSLIHTHLPLLTDYSQLQKGLETEGYIAKTYSKGVLVGFYGNIKVGVHVLWFPWKQLQFL